MRAPAAAGVTLRGWVTGGGAVAGHHAAVWREIPAEGAGVGRREDGGQLDDLAESVTFESGGLFTCFLCHDGFKFLTMTGSF